MSDSSYIIINERYKVQNLLNILISYVFISEYMSKVVRQIKEEADENLPKDTKRAVIFQGGGAIGAYAAGVYAALYYWMKKDITDAENIFDIVAGASAGAINASIIVGHVMASKSKKVKRWEGSVNKLLDFWSFISSSPNFTKWKPFFSYFWPFFGNEKDWITVWDNANFGNVASGEAARRYYSSKEYLYSGAPNVFSYQTNEIDDRFLDNIWPVTNDWYRYDNNALKESIQGYTDFPIKTSPDADDPRLLIVTVDVEEGEQVTFDSHSNNVGFGYTEKGEKKYSIEYKKGLMVEHIMASSSVPVHYDYAMVPVKYDYTKLGGESEPNSESIDFDNGKYRRFWDGGILSNTPLREVIQAHQDLMQGNIPPPSLKVYIVDVWPSVKHYPIASDHDGVINRKNDLIYQDKTFYEEKVTHLISDYKSLVEEFRTLAKQNNLQFKNILSKKAPRSRKRDGSTRTYGELIETVFDIDITRIERTPNENEISFKWCDYSVQTIDNLINQGIKDTLNVMIEESLQRNNQEKIVANKEIRAFINSVEDEKQIQQLDERYAILLIDEAESKL